MPRTGERPAQNGSMPIFSTCKKSERHRIIYTIYQVLIPFTKECKALQFAPDKTLVPDNFLSLDFSTYGGKNSMDMMNTQLPEESYDLIISNHVLEHVKDDLAAIREMIRVVGKNGIVHVCVPSPLTIPKTKDWGFADPSKSGHYRAYGANTGYHFSQAMDNLHIICGLGRDPITERDDIVYWISRSEESLLKITTLLQHGLFSVVRIC